LPTEVVVGLFTLAGVALGFAGQWLMDRQRMHRSRVGILRAVIGELRQNATTLVQGLHAGKPTLEFSAETWQSARFHLGEFLPEPLYYDIQFLYLTLLPIRSLFAEPVPTSELIKRKELPLGWADRARRTVDALQQLPEVRGFCRKEDESSESSGQGEHS
jgi:hypothetical protein